MTTFNVTIPNDKTSLFLEFLELIGGKFEIDEQDFELTEEQKEFLLRQNKVPVEDCIDLENAIDSIKNKHGL